MWLLDDKMTDCLDVYLREKLPYFFADAVLLALFLVELFWLLALRRRGAGTSAFYVWQYVSTLVLYVITYLVAMSMSGTLVYIVGVTDCLLEYDRRFGWIIALGFIIPMLGLTLTSYATCVVLEDKPCKILFPVLLMRTPTAASWTALLIWELIY